MTKKNVNNNLLTVYLILLFQLAFLYYVKYWNQNLSLSDFSILNTGNLLNLLLYLFILAGILFISKNNRNKLSVRSLKLFIILSWILLLLSFGSTCFTILPADYYIYTQPADKVLTGLLFLFYLISILFYLIFLWYSILFKVSPNFLKTLTINFILLITFFVGIMIYINNISYTSEKWVLNKNQKNTAVVLGAAVWSGNVPSPTLSARVDKAIELLNNGFVGEIVLTGGKAPGELAESEVAYEYSKAAGVDSALIRIEDSTSSTTDQIRWIKKNLFNNDSAGDIILISDAYHLPRAIEISKFFNINVKVAESVHKLTFNDMLYNKIRESIALFNFWNFAL